jgi:RNA polymerase sigma factor (sigma-70 family)
MMGVPLARRCDALTERTRVARAIREDTPDAELARLCAEGDERAWAALVHRYRRLVYAIPLRAGFDADGVEEIFHETFARLAEKIGAIRDRERVRSWLVTTARRLTIDEIRRRSAARRRSESEDELEQVPAGDPLPSEALEEIENQHRVRQALLGLAIPCRRLLTMLFYHSSDQPPSYETVAQRLNIPIGSIGPSRARCLARLQAQLAKLDRE